MIALSTDFLLFKLATGESVPFSAEMVSEELFDVSVNRFDPEFLKHAAHAVFHYFKHELGRQTVSVGEFAGAMEKILHGFSVASKSSAAAANAQEELDLDRIAESAPGGELFFYPRLREEFQRQVRQSPRLVRFRGARAAARRIAGSRRWSGRCQVVHDQIIEFLRQCLASQSPTNSCSLLVH